MPVRILIVDDEPSIVKGLKYSLEKDGYLTSAAYDGQEALDLFSKNQFDLILLDVMLPKVDGMEVCQRVRESSDVPIIMLTAKGDDMDKILGLEYGADDYMTKPFNILEVKARIKTILRRVASPTEAVSGAVVKNNIITVGDISVDVDKRRVNVYGDPVSLTAKEFDLLQLFITNRGKVYSRDALLDILWKSDFSGDARTVDVHIRRLREKIERNSAQPEYICTSWGVGYYFVDK